MKMKMLCLCLALAAVMCVCMSGCNPNEGKINDYIKENTAISSEVTTLQQLYGDVMDVKAFGRGNDMVLEFNIKGSLPDNTESDYSALEERLRPYLPGLREATGNNNTNIVYIIKDKDGKETVNKTIS